MADVEQIFARLEADGGDGLLAVVVRAGIRAEGVRFVTAPEESQQVAFMGWPAGHVVPAHVHRHHRRDVAITQEVLHVRSGCVVVGLYNYARQLERQVVLDAGDTIVLLRGGHEVRVAEAAQVFEVKTGPYAGSREADKETW